MRCRLPKIQHESLRLPRYPLHHSMRLQQDLLRAKKAIPRLVQASVSRFDPVAIAEPDGPRVAGTGIRSPETMGSGSYPTRLETTAGPSPTRLYSGLGISPVVLLAVSQLQTGPSAHTDEP